MKTKLILAALLAVAPFAAQAQWITTEPGTKMVYVTSFKNDKGETVEMSSTSTVKSVEADGSGVQTILTEDVHSVPGNEFARVKESGTYLYNPADGLTTVYVIKGDTYREELINNLLEAARSQGQMPSDEEIDKFKRAFRVKGDLTLKLPAEAAPDTKLANSSLKIFAGPQTSSMALWEGKILGTETVEVPAGTYPDCLKVSYTLKQSSPEASGKTYITSWFAKGVGEVKSTISDKNGEVSSEQVLQSVTKE